MSTWTGAARATAPLPRPHPRTPDPPGHRPRPPSPKAPRPATLFALAALLVVCPCPPARGQQDGAAKRLPVAPGDCRIRVQRIPVRAESSDPDIAVVKFLLPGTRLGRIVQQVFDGTMRCTRILCGCDLHRLESKFCELVEHRLERKMKVDRIENSNGNPWFFRHRNRRR